MENRKQKRISFKRKIDRNYDYLLISRNLLKRYRFFLVIRPIIHLFLLDIYIKSISSNIIGIQTSVMYYYIP